VRARVAFSILLATGLVSHLWLLAAQPGRVAVLGVFSAWLAVCIVLVGHYLIRARRADEEELRRRLIRGGRVDRTAVKGVRALLLVAVVTLLLHLMIYQTQSQRQAANGIWLVCFALGAGVYWQLRGSPGDLGAPILDGSPAALAVSRARRYLGWAVTVIGVVLVFLGVGSVTSRPDGLSKVISAFLIVGGALLLAAGAVLIRRPRRNDA